MKYELTSNYGGCVFSNIDDALQAWKLLDPYHNLDYSESGMKKVRNDLELNGYHEDFPLAIQRAGI